VTDHMISRNVIHYTDWVALVAACNARASGERLPVVVLYRTRDPQPRRRR
jgi:hypothetical protein